MKVWVDKKDYSVFKEYSEEGRTITVNISSYRLYEDPEREVLLNLKEEEK